MRVLFIGGHELGKTALLRLLNENVDVIGAVVTLTSDSWYSGVDELAIEYQIPLLETQNINSDESVKWIREISPDLIVVVNFNQILGAEVIRIPQYGCINTHASMLPKYRGRAPLNWAMLNGENETGVTVHYIDEEIDNGDIILQKKISIDETDYIGDLLEKVKRVYPTIVYEAVMLISLGDIEPIRQDKTKAFYCRKRSAEDGKINWNDNPRAIVDLIRAVSNPYPGAYGLIQKEKVIIWKAFLDECYSELDVPVGTIISSSPELVVKLAGRNLIIVEYESAVLLEKGDRLL